MSGSVIRPNPSQWQASLDADQIAESIRRLAFDLTQHGDTLIDYPSDQNVRIAARADARRIVSLCDQLEALSGLGRQ